MVARYALLGFLLSCAACQSSGEMPAGPSGNGLLNGAANDDAGASLLAFHCTAELDSISSSLFQPLCATAGCHEASRAAAALDLSGGDLATRLIGQNAGTCDGYRLIAPGAPDESLLYLKLTGDVPKDCGDSMPPGSTRVAAAAIDCVKEWILSLDPDAAVAPQSGCETCGGSACLDLASDAQHCGDCTNACPSGASCGAGKCECPTGLMLCDGQCVDTQRNAAHCGACGKSCGAGGVCVSGACGCGAGLASCTSGCVELSSDPDNCGACDKPCGAGKFCTPSGCGTAADCVGLTKCGASCVDTSTSLANCGACGNACGAGESCVGGQCGCSAGTELCTGVCLDTSTDNTNCGACGVVCPEGTSCHGGVCECPGGGSSCGGKCIDVTTDANNCGACGNICAPGQACEAGHCACGSSTVSFATDVAPILDQNCTNMGCHGSKSPKEGLDLTLSKSYAELMGSGSGSLTSQCGDGRLLVKPGDPTESYLVQKLIGSNMCSGSQMPKAGTSLPQGDLEAITAWICQGAQK